MPHALVDATAVAGVRALRGVPAQTRDEGSVLSQGDAAHNGPAARALGTTGAGVKVGVISDSIEPGRLGRYPGTPLVESQSTGNLPGPASTPVGSVTVLQDDTTGVIDEGRAMAEIIFDTAPGVTAHVLRDRHRWARRRKASNIDRAGRRRACR